jgi:hypothetical protein
LLAASPGGGENLLVIPAYRCRFGDRPMSPSAASRTATGTKRRTGRRDDPQEG